MSSASFSRSSLSSHIQSGRQTINSLTSYPPAYSDLIPAPCAELRIPDPPSRSPSPPTEVIPHNRGGGNKFTNRFVAVLEQVDDVMDGDRNGASEVCSDESRVVRLSSRLERPSFSFRLVVIPRSSVQNLKAGSVPPHTLRIGIPSVVHERFLLLAVLWEKHVVA
ncbi:hypothetical protein B0H11DRAFT_1997713 [Mycena galericulata]|nr:hypothetical protein B0H11DRAFT_1997713 [Mycena galericulata]